MTELDIHTEPVASVLGEDARVEQRRLPLDLVLIDAITEIVMRKRLIAAITAMAILFGIALSLTLPVQYSAVTTIMPPQQTPSTASMLMNQLSNNAGGSLAAFASGGLGMKNPNDLYIGLINSRPVADQIINDFHLQQTYNAKDMTAARKKLAANTKVASEKDGFISISVTDRDKNRVAEIANAYTRQLRNITKTLAITEAAQRRLFYDDQLRQAREALVTAEISFRQVQQSHGLIAFDTQAKAMIERISELRGQVAAKQVQVDALRSFTTDRNPDLQLAERELTTLQGEVAGIEQRNPHKGFADIGLEDVPGAELDFLRAEHEVKYRQALFDLLIKQYDAARLDEAKEAAIIQVVEPAIVPERKSSPRRTLIVLVFAICGFVGGCASVLWSSWQVDFLRFNSDVACRLRGLKIAATGTRAP